MQLTFDNVLSEVESLANKIKAADFQPDFIVGVARGGWIPTRLLSEFLKVKRLLSFGVTYGDESRTKLVAYSSPDPCPSANKLLVVEDCLESGKSLEFVVRSLSTMNNTVRSASIFITDKTVFVPNYYNEHLSVPPRFPWEI